MRLDDGAQFRRKPAAQTHRLPDAPKRERHGQAADICLMNRVERLLGIPRTTVVVGGDGEREEYGGSVADRATGTCLIFTVDDAVE